MALYVFIEPNNLGLFDGGYIITDTSSNLWGYLPDDLHANGCNLSFADGHVDHYKWKWPKKGRLPQAPILPGPDREDYTRLLAGRARSQ